METDFDSDYEKICLKSSKECDRFICKTCIILACFVCFVWILNITGVFIVKSDIMNLSMISTLVMLGLPVLFSWKKIKIHYTSELTYAYIASTTTMLMVGFLYTILTFHILILFIYPLALFSIYGNKKLSIYVISGTLVIMIASHIASIYFNIVPEEPFPTMHRMLLYGLMPRIIIYCALSYIFLYETDHNNHNINIIYSYAQNIHQTQEELIRSFSEISESKSRQTGQHVKRVSMYTDVMAKHLGIDNLERECLVSASMMHDVGKLMVPTEIIEKPGKLTSKEFDEVKKHTEYGYELLKNSPGHTMAIATKIALEHHERWDGTGYKGKIGDEIDFYSRIIAICDVFDALVSKRSYKEKWNSDDAYNEIISQSGKQFDPELVELFKECYQEFLDILKKLPD